MKRILLLYYSQSGDVAQVARTFIGPLAELPGVEVTTAPIEPVEPYPFPWGSLTRLLSVLPECHRGGGCAIRPLAIDTSQAFDLVVFIYQVWHLAPSLAVQGFFKSEDAKVLNGARVITLCVCHNMWHSGAEAMKRLLREAGALHLDNAIVNHQGPPFATFVSVPRLLLFGKRDRLWGIFPPAEISQHDLDHVRRLGSIVADKLREQAEWPRHSLLAGAGAVRVKRRYVIPERLGWHGYQLWADVILWAASHGAWARRLALYAFEAGLLLMIFLGLPVMLVVLVLLYPFTFQWVERYAAHLAEPSGEAVFEKDASRQQPA